MHIKNISQILNFKGEKSEITKGNIINAKVISLLNNKGVVKLPNGSVLPCIFLFNEGIEENMNYKFLVKEFHAQEILLEVLKDTGRQARNTNIDNILEKLNISKSQGEEIISKLIKFNIPAKDETILDINKNYNFLKDLISLKDNELLNIIKNLTGKNLTENSKEFQNIKSTLNNLKSIDLDFLTFLKENNIPPTLNNILKVNDFIKNPFVLNNFIKDVESNIPKDLTNLNKIILNDKSNLDEIKSIIKNNTGYDVDKTTLQKTLLNVTENKELAFKLTTCNENDFLRLCKEIVKNPLLTEKSPEFVILKEFASGNLNKVINIKQENLNLLEKLLLNALNLSQSSKDNTEAKLSSINSTLNNIKDFPDASAKLPFNILNSVMENVDINKYVYNNYSILNFNFKLDDNLYKNKIIIKNKHSKEYIDINDVKLYISVENEKIGLVEGCISKNFKTININLNVNKNYINDFIKTTDILKNKLSNIGYSDCNIKIEEFKNQLDILSLSSFFNDDNYFDLDVKV